MASFNKEILINIYEPIAGAYIATWSRFQFQGFTKALDAGLGECVVVTDMAFDYAGADLLLGNDVEIRISDVDTANDNSNAKSRIIYKGYISLIERDVEGQTEGVTVHMVGYYTLLALDVLKNSAQTTLYSNSSTGLTTTIGSINAADIGLMIRTVLDRYAAENSGSKITYDPANIPNTSTTAIYSFKQRTYRQALDDLKALAPGGLFYYVNELGSVSFKQKPTSPTHQFVFGKHFNKVHVEHSLEKVRNFFLLWNGTPSGGSKVYKHYQDDASVAQYKRRVQTDNDYVSTSTAADLQGVRFLADNAKPDVKVTCTIYDNNSDQDKGYDIESIQPGDTCSFYGFSAGFDDIFQDNMIITQVVYTLDSVELTVEVIKSSLIDIQNQQGQTIDDISTGGLLIPESYT